MQIEQLKYLVEIVKTSSISQAAENLFVSQPAVSMSLKNLEKELNITLFKRTKNGILLTKEGQIASGFAKDFLLQYKIFETNIHVALSDQPNPLVGILHIEAVPNISYGFLPKVLATFMKQNPKIHLSIIEKNNTNITSHVRDQICDLGIIIYLEDMKEKYDDLVLFPLITSKHYVLANNNHPLATKSQVCYKDIYEYKLITHSFHKDDTYLDDTVFGGTPPEIVLRASSMQIVLQNVSQTGHITILSHLLLDYALLNHYNIVAIPIIDSMSLRFGALYKQDSPKIRIIQHFLNHLVPYC